MEVCIQSHNDPTALARKVDNLRIVMREALIEQQPASFAGCP
jgi:hypothetical protein